MEHLVKRQFFLAAWDPFGGSRLQALPFPQLGIMLGPIYFSMTSALRVGAPICELSKCAACGSDVDSDGLYPLSCARGPGRAARHADLNAVLQRALRRAKIPSTLEPRGLELDGGLRPDGVTIPTWHRSKSLIWDVTVSCTAAQSYLGHSASTPRWAAEHVAARSRNTPIYRRDTTLFPWHWKHWGPPVKKLCISSRTSLDALRC